MGLDHFFEACLMLILGVVLDWLVQCRALSPEETELTDRMVLGTERSWVSGPGSTI